eukprot:scaffold2512_cov232-Chaetoceros_neogracile.AAC.3
MTLLASILNTLSHYSRQLAFAIAPIPAYLPQYFTLCNSSNDPVLHRKIGNPTKKSESFVFDHHDENTGSPHGHPNHAPGRTHRTRQITESGLSSTSIMILLISHIFRLQYFLGSAIINVFGGDSNYLGKADRVHYDLVTQSLVMVAIQLMLLSAVTRRRRMSAKIKKDDAYSTEGDNMMPSPRESSISQPSFIWIIQPRRHWHWNTVHQYVELIIVVTIMTYAFGRYYLYPSDFLEYISTVKIISVLLESCLALPQIILNYKRTSTEGLSLVMVFGWVVGDLLKMMYFILGSGILNHRNKLNTVVSSETEEDSDMTAFIFGCVFALIMDVIVGLQVCKHYPSRDMIALQDKSRRAWKRFEIRVLQIDQSSSSLTPPIMKGRAGSLDGNDLTC